MHTLPKRPEYEEAEACDAMQVETNLNVLKAIRAHLTEGRPLPDGTLAKLNDTINNAPGVIDLDECMEVLSAFGGVIFPSGSDEVEGVRYVEKTHAVSASDSSILDLQALGEIPCSDRESAFLYFALSCYASDAGPTMFLRSAFLTASTPDPDSFTPRRFVVLRVMERVDD